MMKKLPKWRASLIFALFLLITQFAFAQVPPEDLTGEELKAWLRTNYYDGKHQTLGYTTARMYLYNYIDNENGVITCVYSGLEVNSAYGGTTTYPAPINCEHTIPQSYFGEADPMVSDIHHLYPTYENWNSTRSNYPLTDINDNETAKWMYLDQSQTTIPTSNIDLYSEYANSTFEPREDHKGNAARSIFYFYTMYPTQAGNISQIGDINIFYQWHLADPVDAEEIERNGEVETYQGNRNPFIDYPELVARAWGFTVVETVPSTPAIQMNAGETSISLSWTNVSNENGYKLYKSINGSSYNLLSDVAANTTSYTDNSVSEDITYYYYVFAYNDYGNSGNSNIVSGELNTGGSGGTGTTTDLLFSEYIEGSSYNKGLEVANFTGTAVDLSNYSIRKQTNGAGDWGTILTLSGSLAHGDVFVVVNSSASVEMKAVADLETGVDALTFNGNDPLGLFKNGTLIDMIGTFNSALIFAQDVTLVRNFDVLSPNTTYTASEWTTYPVDTYTYLGSHTIDGETIDTEAPTAPTSLASANITETSFTLSWSASTDNVAVTGYNIYQNGSLLTSTSNTTYNVSGLTPATTYNYYITAKDAAGNISDASNTLSVTTSSASDTEAPTTPTSLASANITESSFTLSWSASTDNVAVTGYNIYQNGSLLTSTSNTTYNVSGLTAAITYNYYITAKDAAGNISDASNTLSVTTSSAADTEAPTTPTNLASANITESSFTLSWSASTDNVAVTGYNIYQNGSLLTSTSNTTYNISGLTAATTYNYYITAKDAAGNISDASNTLSVTTSDIVISYCTSQSDNSTYEWIANIEIGTYSNSSGAANYTDFTSENISLAKGSSVSLTLSPGFSSSSYSEYWKIWIDYNGDKDFDDTDELVFDAGSLSSSAVSGNINILATASGSTRMRVSMKYNAEQTACETFGYGEVEDYTVTFTDAIPDTEAPTVPTSLAASNITFSGSTLSWNASTDNIAVTEYEIYQDGSYVGNTATTNYNVSGLSSSTSYTFAVRAKDAAGNISALSNSIIVTTPDVQITYCDSYGTSTADEWLNQVIIANINNTSVNNGGYGDFTNLIANVETGSTYNITLYPGFSGRNYKEVYSIWIDYNQDGSFDPSTELVFNYTSKYSPVTGSFTVPDNASIGSTRMRISMKYNVASIPCEIFGYGEVEDYTVNIAGSKTSTLASLVSQELSSPNNSKVKLYPNPAENVTNLELISEINTSFEYKVMDINGRVISAKKDIQVCGYKEEQIDISNLKSGIYFIMISNQEYKETFKLIVK